MDSPNVNLPARHWQPERPSLAGFFLAVLLTFALAGYTYWISEQQRKAEAWVGHAREVLTSISRLRTSFDDIVGGVRSFVISGSEADLVPYNNAVGRITDEINQLAALTADDPAQRTGPESLGPAMGALLASMRAIVDARQFQGFGAAQKLLTTDTTKQQQALVQAQLDALQHGERDLFEGRSVEELANLQRFKATVLVLMAVMAVMFGFQYLSLRRRHSAEIARWRSEERFRLLAEAVQDYAIIMLDDKGNVTSWGAGAERIKGYRVNDILGEHFSVFYPPEDIQAGKPLRILDEAAATGRIEDEGWRMRKNGSRFWADVVITAVRDHQGKLLGFGKVTRDLTERRRAEDALQAEVEERKAAEEALRQMNLDLEGRVAERTELQTNVNRMLEEEMAERKRAEAEMREARQRLASIIESAMDAIITVDETQRIVLFNAAAEGVFGCARDAALGAPLTKFIPERFRAAHADHVARFGETGASSRRMGALRIVMGLRSTGEEFPIEASISQVTEHGHRFYTVILRDVTVRVLAEAALKASKDELRELASAAHTVREQEKSRIARELHDELAQSLSSMKMDVATAQQELPADLEWLSSKLEAMQATLDGMVMATRRIAADLRPLMLDDLGLVPAAEWLVQTFTQRTGIRCEFSADPPELTLQDPYATAIFRILQESLANVGRHAHASLVEVTLDVNDGMIVLRVRDNGRGFEPAGPRKPASLGLIGLRERATLLDGEIHIDAAPGRGTVVEVHIPLKNIRLSP